MEISQVVDSMSIKSTCTKPFSLSNEEGRGDDVSVYMYRQSKNFLQEALMKPRII